MRAPVLRLIAVAFLAQAATACASYSAFNPFDDDPNGPPPAPHLFAENGNHGPDIVDTRRPREAVDEAPMQLAAVETDTARRVTPSSSANYGTSDVDAAPLPPPEYRDEATPREEARAPAPPPPLPPEPIDPPPAEIAAADVPPANAERTLSTGRKPLTAIPPETKKPRSVVHKVKAGEELADIADGYGAREVDIIAINGMKPPYKLAKGQEIRVPVTDTAMLPPEPGDSVTAGDTVPAPKPVDEPAKKPSKAAESGAPVFDWPVSGKIVSAYGARGNGLYNEGINISVPVGTPVRASAGGTVRYAGNELRGYGNLILIEHAGGYVTAYAHNDSLSVKRGEKVERGQVIAKSGQTGNVKSPQLHFEIRKGTESVDPTKYLTS